MVVKIRPLEEADAYKSVKWRNDPQIWIHTAYKSMGDVNLEDEIKWVRSVMNDDSCRRFAILADGVYIGNIYLTGIAGGEAEYGIFIGDKNYWGKGIARKASEQIINYAHDVLKLKSIKLGVSESNQAAMKLYKSLNFTEYGKEGRFTRMRLDMKNWKNNEEK